MRSRTGSGEAIVVGAGPNGLAAAVTLALSGFRVTVFEAADTIGGGTRSGELEVPGVVFDHCSSAHVVGAGSPFLRSLDLEPYGLEWLWPEIDLAHPLDSGGAGALYRSVGRTADGLGADGHAWRRLFGPLAADAEVLADAVMRPLARLPRQPLRLARFGFHALQPATLVAKRFRTDEARGVFGGVAAHLFGPLTQPVGAAIGLMIIAMGHRFGWPVAKGGSRAVHRHVRYGRAVRGEPGAAVVAAAAVDRPGDDHEVAGGDGGDGVARVDHPGHALVADRERRVDEAVARQDRGVDVAGGGGHRGDDRLLSGLELRVGGFAPLDRVPGGVDQFTHRRAAPSPGPRGRRGG
ncbi:NAD(P)/FAD-dependent oxidoreductase [Streptomyces sp. PRKS01-29]|nr:NAD(P)/FAD-dependent oxidoreductase [Streptomyces sabulosicollis]